MNYTPNLRPQAKRYARKRQLLALAAVAFLAFLAIPTACSFGQAISSPSSAGELRAAKLMELNLTVHGADAADWQKLGRMYADMDVKFPRNAAVKGAWAQFLWDRGEKRQAIEKWESVTEIEPRNAPALSNLGEGYLEMGEIKKSASAYSRASESAPSNASYHFDLANVVFMFRHDLLDATAPDADAVMRRALGHFAEAARLEPLNVEYAKAYADTYYALQPPDWAGALAAWEHFLEISPLKDFAYANLARVHINLGQKAEARACLAQIHAADFDRLKARLNQRIDAE